MRLLKVYESSGMLGRDVPKIQLQGKWLSELGYSVGDYIKVDSDGDKLIIMKDDTRRIAEEQIQRKIWVDSELRNICAKFVERNTIVMKLLKKVVLLVRTVRTV